LNYIHGGNIYKYKKNIIDFSSNINPLGMPDNLIKDINDSIEDIINYPDPDYIKLRTKIASNYNVDYKNIVVGNGGIQLIHNAIEFINGESILIVSPSFVEYEKASKRFNKEVKYYLLLEENDFKLKIDEFLKFDFNDIDNVIICNPNNPTGKYIEKKDIIKIIEYLKLKNINLILDESFMDFLDDKLSLIDKVNKYDNLIIIRSLTKFFAVPGLRLGFLVSSNNELKNKINKYRESWSVNIFANEFGINVFDNNEYILKTKEYIYSENKYLFEQLNEMNLFKVYSSVANYIFLKSKYEIDWKKELLNYNILIRKCDNYIGLNDRFYRVAVKDNDSNLKLINSIKKIKEKLNGRFN